MASDVAERASRPAALRADASNHSELFRAFAVFREGAENHTRGACAPRATSESGFQRLARLFSGEPDWLIPMVWMTSVPETVLASATAPTAIRFPRARARFYREACWFPDIGLASIHEPGHRHRLAARRQTTPFAEFGSNAPFVGGRFGIHCSSE